MNYAILEPEDYEKAPEEPIRKFVALEQAARHRMNDIMDRADSSSIAMDLKSQYMTLMISIADTLGIPGITYPSGQFQHEWEEHQVFASQVQGVIAKIMLNRDLVASPSSVRLASKTKSKIEGQLCNLRGLIENSDLPANRRAKLIAKLDEFVAELNRPRLNFASVAIVATALLANLQSVTATLADAPNATQTVGTILKWIGQDKEAEDQEQERLGPPPSLLPAPPKQPQALSSEATNSCDFDDDIPF